MKPILVFFLSLFAGLAVSGQTSPDCDAIIDRQPNFITITDPYHPDRDSLIMADLIIIALCGKMDSTDLMVLSTSFLATLLTSNGGKPLTYRYFIDAFNSFKKTKEYITISTAMRTAQQLEQKKIDPATWEQDKKLFVEMGLEPEKIKALEEITLNPHNTGLTYKEAFEKELNSTPTVEVAPIQFRSLSTYDAAVAEAKKEKKMLLIYFTAEASVNAKKMENTVFKDKEVRQVLKYFFVSFSATCDDNTTLKKSAQNVSAKTNKTISTVGQKNLDIEQSVCGKNQQPYFVIVDPQQGNKVIRQSGYVQTAAEFLIFLEDR